MEQQNLLDNNHQQNLPNATASLVLGILSLVFCFAYGVVGFILGIIGLVLANKDRRLYQSNPDAFTKASFTNSNAGRTCSIIGIILSGIFLLFLIIVISFGLSAGMFNHLR